MSARSYYLDNLRAIACITVILLHISGPYLYITNSVEFQFVNFLHSLSRFCVPIFLMISGTLLLGKKQYWKTFYKDRIPKLLKPLIFWSLFYFVILISINSLIHKNFSFIELTEILKNSILYGAAYHLWYMYLIITIYLVLPFFSNFDNLFYNRHVLYLSSIWMCLLVIAQFLPELTLMSWLRFLIGYFGYLVLGYYCSKISPGVIGSSVVFVLGLLSTFLPNFYSVELNYSWFYYLNINVVFLSGGVYLLLKELNTKSDMLNLIAQHSFGIYFIHLFFIMLLNKIWIPGSFYAPIQILVSTILCLMMSYYAIVFLKRIKPLASFIY